MDFHLDHLLNLPDVTVSSCQQQEGFIFLQLDFINEGIVCPHCQTYTDNLHQTRPINVGWENGKRVYGCVIHLDIKNNKIWVQYNGTEIDIARKLVELGVPKTDIVLGFQAPHRRQYTDYAIS